jgi:hypothetical protein
MKKLLKKLLKKFFDKKPIESNITEKIKKSNINKKTKKLNISKKTIESNINKKTKQEWYEILKKEIKIVFVEPTSHIENKFRFNKNDLLTKEEFMDMLTYSKTLNSYALFQKW